MGKAAGSNNINNRILKELPNQLAKPLCNLFNNSLLTRKFPSQWKVAHVRAVFKKDDTRLVSNYRPLSLLCTISKE